MSSFGPFGCGDDRLVPEESRRIRPFCLSRTSLVVDFSQRLATMALQPAGMRAGTESIEMIIIHASASDGRLVLWGETSPGSPGKKPRKAARRIEPARPGRSRFALEEDRLAEAVAGEVPGIEISKDQRQCWVAWLPSNEEGALPSSPLLTERPEDQAAVKLACWEVPAVVLTTEQAVAVLVAGIDRATWGPGVVVGKTLAYWATALRFAGALVARQQYLPGIAAGHDGTTLRACWEPVLTGVERLHAEQLARSMPHACRALNQDAANPPQPAASTVLAEVLGTLVDHLVRTAAPPAEKRSGRFASLHDQWLHALARRTAA